MVDAARSALGRTIVHGSDRSAHLDHRSAEERNVWRHDGAIVDRASAGGAGILPTALRLSGAHSDGLMERISQNVAGQQKRAERAEYSQRR